MTDNSNLVEILQAENFSAESGLGREDKKLVNKMFNYIKKFPISAYDVELIRKDIIGMAEEAEQRGRRLTDMIGTDHKKFCNELIVAIAGMEVPGGWRYLNYAGLYCEIMGWISIINGFLGVTMIPVWLAQIGRRGFEEQFGDLLQIILEFAFPLLMGLILKKAGEVARTYCGDISKVDVCMKWGWIVLAMQVITYMKSIVLSLMGDGVTGFLPGEPYFIFNWIGIAFHFTFVWMYLKGARINKKAGAH